MRLPPDLIPVPAGPAILMVNGNLSIGYFNSKKKNEPDWGFNI